MGVGFGVCGVAIDPSDLICTVCARRNLTAAYQ
jgi:hypothetical protein